MNKSLLIITGIILGVAAFFYFGDIVLVADQLIEEILLAGFFLLITFLLVAGATGVFMANGHWMTFVGLIVGALVSSLITVALTPVLPIVAVWVGGIVTGSKLGYEVPASVLVAWFLMTVLYAPALDMVSTDAYYEPNKPRKVFGIHANRIVEEKVQEGATAHQNLRKNGKVAKTYGSDDYSEVIALVLDSHGRNLSYYDHQAADSSETEVQVVPGFQFKINTDFPDDVYMTYTPLGANKALRVKVEPRYYRTNKSFIKVKIPGEIARSFSVCYPVPEQTNQDGWIVTLWNSLFHKG